MKQKTRETHRNQELRVNGKEEMEEMGRPAPDVLVLRLYVADDAPNSTEALANLKVICEGCLEPGTYRLEIVDVLEEPLRALHDGILVTPTLIKVSSPGQSIVGTLSDHERVRRALRLEG